MAINSIPQSTDQRQHVADCALYRHFSSDGSLLYVGISISAARRLGEHQSSPWARQIAHVTIEWLRSREEAIARESYAIRHEKPKFNIAYGACNDADLARFLPTPMTPTELKQALAQLGLRTQADAAKAVQFSRQASISDMLTGRKAITPQTAELVRAYLSGYRPANWPGVVALRG